jgi:hypothetical protein
MNNDPDDHNDSLQTAENLLRVRSLRSDVFPSEIFDEHAWNMLLHLFVAQAKGEEVSEASLVTLTGTSPDIGQRWLAHLVADAQVEPHANGGAVTLTSSARDCMEGFLRDASRIHQTDGST